MVTFLTTVPIAPGLLCLAQALQFKKEIGKVGDALAGDHVKDPATGSPRSPAKAEGSSRSLRCSRAAAPAEPGRWWGEAETLGTQRSLRRRKVS